MKITTQSQQQGYIDSTIEGGIKGLLLGSAVIFPAGMVLNRQSPFFRRLPLPAKAFLTVSLLVPTMSVAAEKAGEAYSRTQWTGVGKQEMDMIEKREQERWERLGTWGQVGDWAKRRKWAIIGGSWVAAMGGSFALVSRNKYQSFSQKLVQARVYAQAWTIGLLLIAAFVSGTGIAESDTVAMRPGDHSWREILEQEGYLQKLRDGQVDPDRRETQLEDAKRLAEPRRGD